MRLLARGVIAAAGLLAASSAAHSAPPLGPHAPTLVTYRVLNQQTAVPPVFTVLFAPESRAARITFSGNAGYMLVDADRHTLTMVLDQPRISFEIPTPPMFAPYFDWRRTVAFTRGPRGRAAGQDCTVWRAQSDNGSGTICFSADGVPLRIDAVSNKGERTDVEALSVAQAAYDPAMFAVPADHPSLQMKGLNLSPFGGSNGF